MQMICALLVFRTPELPDRLATLSPWLDWLVLDKDEVFARLAGQDHRRFVKTHTPLDGVPIDPRATYIVVARHPLDLAVSLYHQSANLDRARIAALTGNPAPPPRATPRPEAADWVRAWVDSDDDPREVMDSLPGVMWHLSDAWARRHEPNVVLVHYDDLQRDLRGQMEELAVRLGIEVPDERWPALVEAAGFTAMKADADRLAPDPRGVLKDRQAFFRGGRSGAGRALLDDAGLARYRRRAGELAPADLLRWLHREGDAA
jgi:hypothetical protein